MDIATNPKIIEFENILRKWNKAYNLVQRKSLDDFLKRHALDSAELFDEVYSFQTKNPDKIIADLGSGAGLPAVILSILGIKNFILIESCGKKSSFLLEVKRALDLDFEVFRGRIEDFNQKCTAFTARALADSSKIVEFVMRMPKTDSKTIWLLKGPKVIEEVKQLSCNFSISKGKFTDNTFVLKIEM